MNVKVNVIKRTPMLDGLERRLQKQSLSEKLATEFAKDIKTAISQRVNSKSGAGTKNLMNSIKVINSGKNSRSSGIVGADYYWYANYGRAAGNAPPVNGKLAAWAARSVKWQGRKGAERLAKHIAEFGTQGKYFHEVAKARFQTRKSKIIKEQIGIR